MKREEILNDLKNNLSEYRFKHSLLVAKEAEKLALKYHEDKDKAFKVGLLHDIAKELSPNEELKYIKKDDILLNKENEKIKHASIGALMAKEKYNVTEDEYLAIKYHTTGNIKMNNLAKIIFIADKIGRENLSTEMLKAKELAYQDLDKALLYILELNKNYLEQKKEVMANDSLVLLDYLKKRVK